MPLPTVRLARDLARSIRTGHPWIYDRALGPFPRGVRAGDLVAVVGAGGLRAVGVADPESAIAVRVLEVDADAAIDDAWVTARVAAAAAARTADPALVGTDAFRVIHGENDYLPGLILDRYADTAVAAFDGAGAAAFWRPRAQAIARGCRAGGVSLARAWEKPPRGRAGGGVLWGDEPAPVLFIDEHGARFEVDVRHGQKTGLFLDQRDNRRLVGALAAGAEVLNLFGYSGGFSVHAALGGARRVTTVDSAAPAIAACRRNFAANQIPDASHPAVVADAFEFLEEASRAGRRFDLVICDPPSFAPSARSRSRGLSAYRRLNALALAAVAPGGVLVTASCSSHVTATDMLEVVAEASRRSRRRVRVRDIRGAATDHPVRPGFAEGRYLDLLVAHVE